MYSTFLSDLNSLKSILRWWTLKLAKHHASSSFSVNGNPVITTSSIWLRFNIAFKDNFTVLVYWRTRRNLIVQLCIPHFRCLVDLEMSGENVKLFVGNLPIDATHEEISKIFSPYGEINTCSLLRQYAFVTLKGEGAADRYGAIQHHCFRL